MSSEEVSLFLLFLFISYFAIHLPFDIYMMMRRNRSNTLTDYGINSPDKINLIMGSMSLLFWFLWIMFCIPSILIKLQTSAPWLFLSGTVFYLFQVIAIFLSIVAILIVNWGRITRGRYAASWGLNDTIPLFKNGPFRYVRHPSYLFYILMFISIPMITGFWLGFVLIIGIPAYNKIADDEERLLVYHFKEEYIRYRRNTGKFFPIIRQNKIKEND